MGSPLRPTPTPATPIPSRRPRTRSPPRPERKARLARGFGVTCRLPLLEVPIRTLLLALALHATAAHADDASRAESLLRAGRLVEAIPAAREEAAAHPTDLERQERWIDLLLGMGRAEEAVRTYDQRVKGHPDDPDAHYLLGRAIPNPEASLRAYEQALRLDPDHARSHMGIAALQRVAGRLDRAGASYQRALQLDPTLDEAWAGLLALVMSSGEREAILQVATAALTKVPDLVEAWLARATWDPENAGPILAEAVKRAPWDARLHAALAEHLLGEGKAQLALQAARAAREVDPRNKGAILLELFADEVARGVLDTAGWQALADARELESDDPAAAAERYDALVASYPEAATPRMARARVRTASTPAGALADLEAAVALSPDNEEASAALGLLLAAQGRPLEAAQRLRDVWRIRPWDGSLAVAGARAFRAAGLLDDAVALAGDAARRNPFDLDVVLVHVEMLAESGDAQKAWTTARDAAERLDDVRAALAAAAAAQQAGHLLEAAKRFDALAERTGREAFAITAARIRRDAAEAR